MRVLHVVHTLEPKADGVASFLTELIRCQREAGLEVSCVEGVLPQRSATLVRRLAAALEAADIAHLHALWVPSTFVGGHLALLRRKPYVVTLHGMLDPWALARSRVIKLVARKVGVDRVLRNATCLHALCEPEREAIRAQRYGNPVAVIPPGIDPGDEAVDGRAGGVTHRTSSDGLRDVLFMGRLHPKKGLDIVAEAFARLAPRYQEWRLVVAGPDQGGLTSMMKSRLAGVEESRVVFTGHVAGVQKRALLDRAEAFVLPSHSEGLPVAVLEAMSSRIPVVISRNCNLPDVARARAGVLCDASVASFTEALESVMSASGAEREAMGRSGRALVLERFSSRAVAWQLAEMYRWAVDGGPDPGTLVLAS